MAAKVDAKDVREGNERPARNGANTLVDVGRKFLPHVGVAGVLVFSTSVTNPQLLKWFVSLSDNQVYRLNDSIASNLWQ